MHQNVIRVVTASQKSFVNTFSLLFVVAILAQAAAASIIKGKATIIKVPDMQLPMMK